MSKRTQRKESAFAAGKLAKREGKLKKDNPYKNARNGNSLHPVWLAGWNRETAKK